MHASLAPRTIALQSLTEVSALIHQRQLSPVEVVTTCLERIERLQPQLNAFIAVAADAALQEASVAEREVQHGRWKGPLHGIPVGIKDFYDAAGFKTTAAFEPFRERVPPKDAVSVETLKRAGAIVIGKTNMHTLGMGTTGLVSCFGPVRNPWNVDYIPGGSSSGSAAAVASGLCYATLDTDAIGSCRLPAACCGVVGYKGTYDLVDTEGILGGAPPPDDTIRWLSHAGLTTRDIRDTALLLEVLARPVPKQPGSWQDALIANRRLRVGVANNCPVAHELSNAVDHAVRTIGGLGHLVRHTSAPLADAQKGVADIVEDRQAIGRSCFSEIDVLVLPTTTTTTPEVRSASNALALSPAFTMFANYYGLPAVSLPCGLDGEGLPLGFQLVAQPGADAAVLQLAWQYQQAAGVRRHPPMA